MNTRLLDRIDMIQEASIDAELEILNSMTDTYLKALLILQECDESADLSAFGVFQEAVNREDSPKDLYGDQSKSLLAQAKGNPNESLIKRILLFLPRLIKAIITKLKSSSRMFKNRLKKLERECKGMMKNQSSNTKGDTVTPDGMTTHEKTKANYRAECLAYFYFDPRGTRANILKDFEELIYSDRYGWTSSTAKEDGFTIAEYIKKFGDSMLEQKLYDEGRFTYGFEKFNDKLRNFIYKLKKASDKLEKHNRTKQTTIKSLPDLLNMLENYSNLMKPLVDIEGVAKATQALITSVKDYESSAKDHMKTDWFTSNEKYYEEAVSLTLELSNILNNVTQTLYQKYQKDLDEFERCIETWRRNDAEAIATPIYRGKIKDHAVDWTDTDYLFDSDEDKLTPSEKKRGVNPYGIAI